MRRKGWMLSLLGFLVAGCAAPVTYDHPSKSLDEKQRDYVECAATASQAAQGAGDWSRDRALRTAFYQDSRDRYLAMCLESRGWRGVASGQNVGSTLTPEEQERACQSYAAEIHRRQCLETLRKAR